jgi:hypothetical protein
MDFEKVKQAIQNDIRAREMLNRAEREIKKLYEASYELYSSLRYNAWLWQTPEELEKKWKAVVKAAEKVLRREAKK